jgi:hypothetical protein
LIYTIIFFLLEKEHEIKINKLLGELDEDLSGEEDIDDYINNLEKEDDD